MNSDSGNHGESWWLVVITSIVSILFGIATLFMPGLTLATLIFLFAVYVLVYGIVEMIHGFSSIGKDSNWWVSALIGVLLLGVGVYLAKHPAISTATFITIIGWVLVIRGVFDVGIGLFFRGDKMRWILAGVISLIAGIIVWSYPVGTALAFTWVLGLYALLNGVILLSRAITAKEAMKK